MIIKCEKCNTAFQTDESISTKMAWGNVRCLKCGRACAIDFSPAPEKEATPAQRKSWKGFKIRLIISAMILLVLSLGFTALLTFSSLEKLYVASQVSQYSAIGKDLQRNLEKSLKFGKSIRKFIGIDDLLQETRETLVGITDLADGTEDADIAVSVSLPNGNIVYSTKQQLQGSQFPAPVQEAFDKKASQELDPETHVKYKDTYYVTLPVHQGFRKEQVAFVVISFGEAQVTDRLQVVLSTNIRYILIILATGFLLLTGLINWVMRPSATKGSFPKLKISIVMFLVIGLSQIVFAALNTQAFKTYYLDINKKKTYVLANLLRKDIEYFLSLGRPIDRLSGMDKMMNEIIHAAPELENIIIFGDGGRPLYIATKKGVTNFQTAFHDHPSLAYEFLSAYDPIYNLRLQIQKEGKTEGYLEGYISTNISKAVIKSRIRQILLDAATVLVISLLFFVELYILLLQFLGKPVEAGQTVIHYGAVRPAAFFFFFGINVCVTFLPLYMGQLYDPLWGLSKDVIMGVPISVKMLFSGIGIFSAGIWLDHKGWHQPFLSGVILAGCGYIYAWQAIDARHFIASQAVAGLGYGFTLMACQGFVASYTDSRNKAQGLAQLWAGVFAGAICGGAAGAMLAERIGYSPVFLMGASIIFFVAVYALLFMRRAMSRPAARYEKTVQPAKLKSVLRFIFRRNIFALILFSNIPASVALVGFLNYFCPIYLNKIGVSQSSIGRVFMGFDLCIIYLAPLVSRTMDRAKSKKPYILAGDLLSGFAFAIFYLLTYFAFGGLIATVAAVLLLGLASCLSDDARSAYILNLKATRELGEGKALGIFSSTERVGQMLGPMIFSWSIAAIGIQQSMPVFGLSLMGVALLFALASSRGKAVRKNETTSDSGSD